ncbi:hypothetical protein EHS39_33025 [Ensifer sp. MPMI2T]|nr:hypothetical protein EHS39_33025 [Ensifer sp. MPMI2T]
MATGQGILDRLKRRKVEEEEHRGVLPLRAFYGREEEAETQRRRMYDMVERVMSMPDVDEDALSSIRQRGGFNRVVSLGSAIALLDANSSPVEFLVSRGEMEMGEDEEGMGGARFHTALRFRDLMEGSQVKSLKSPSLSGGGGGGGTSAGDIRGYQLDCMKLVEKLRKSMPKQWVFPLLESTVWRDDWLDLVPKQEPRADKREALKKERMMTVRGLHFALDCAALTLGYIPEGAFTQRWSRVPGVPPVVRRRMRASMAASRLALQT